VCKRCHMVGCGSECWVMRRVYTRRMQAAEIGVMCGGTLRDIIPNGLLGDGTDVENIENHLGETRLK